MIGPRYPHTITVYHPTGTDKRGNPTGVTTTGVKARVTFSDRQIRAPDSTMKDSTALVETGHHVEVGDTITLPDGSKHQVIQRHIIDGLGGKESNREAYL